jgi:CxxC motif-containing protein (DUF1111 family)
MHDDLSFSVTDAIRRHDNPAEDARRAFDGLSNANKSRLLKFLDSL